MALAQLFEKFKSDIEISNGWPIAKCVTYSLMVKRSSSRNSLDVGLTNRAPLRLQIR